MRDHTKMSDHVSNHCLHVSNRYNLLKKIHLMKVLFQRPLALPIFIFSMSFFSVK